MPHKRTQLIDNHIRKALGSAERAFMVCLIRDQCERLEAGGTKSPTQNFHDGHWWWYFSLPAWAEYFPYLSLSTIRRHIRYLKNIGVVRVYKLGTKGDQTHFFRIDDDAVKQLLGPSVQIEQMVDEDNDHLFNLNIPSVQIEQDHLFKLNRSSSIKIDSKIDSIIENARETHAALPNFSDQIPDNSNLNTNPIEDESKQQYVPESQKPAENRSKTKTLLDMHHTAEQALKTPFPQYLRDCPWIDQDIPIPEEPDYLLSNVLVIEKEAVKKPRKPKPEKQTARKTWEPTDPLAQVFENLNRLPECARKFSTDEWRTWLVAIMHELSLDVSAVATQAHLWQERNNEASKKVVAPKSSFRTWLTNYVAWDVNNKQRGVSYGRKTQPEREYYGDPNKHYD